jgi:predicted dienelactone hydrolase
MARRLPKASTQYLEISDASHFSFMSICKPGAVKLLEADVPGDGIICGEGEGARSREVIHGQVVGLISEFLAKSFRN